VAVVVVAYGGVALPRGTFKTIKGIPMCPSGPDIQWLPWTSFGMGKEPNKLIKVRVELCSNVCANYIASKSSMPFPVQPSIESACRSVLVGAGWGMDGWMIGVAGFHPFIHSP